MHFKSNKISAFSSDFLRYSTVALINIISCANLSRTRTANPKRVRVKTMFPFFPSDANYPPLLFTISLLGPKKKLLSTFLKDKTESKIKVRERALHPSKKKETFSTFVRLSFDLRKSCVSRLV